MSRGGMRWGAGRPGYRAKAEQLQRVEIGRWQREGRLRAESVFTWSWSCGSEPAGSIGVRVYGPHSLALVYTVAQHDGQRLDGSQRIALDATECNYGGSRPWFVCPVCHSRAGVLYLRAARFACRACQRVAYTSQSCDWLDRVWRRQAKAESRLGESCCRPKGMRRHTYERLIDQIGECRERREVGVAEFIVRNFGDDAIDALGLR